MTLQLIVIIGILSIWLIYQVVLMLFAREKEVYNFLILVIFITSFAFYHIADKLETSEYEYTFYFLVGYLVANFFIRGLIKHFKRQLSEYDYYQLEKTIEEINESSELLRKRFISTIEILHDGISFRDPEGTLFGSDKYIEYVGLESNNFTVEEFEKLIYKDDLVHYQNTIEKTSKKSPLYKVDYRVKKDGDLLWIKEVGKRIIIDKKPSYISIVKPMDIKQFPESEIDVLNGLKDYKKMYEQMQALTRKKESYNLVMIQLTNIPKINDKYGREVGDLMMGEYLKKLQYNFMKDRNSIYRISGITFGLLIKDEKKFEILERALTGSGELLNLNMVFGGITQTLYPNLGISESPYEGKNPDKMIEEALEALNISLKDSSNTNYCFYDRI